MRTTTRVVTAVAGAALILSGAACGGTKTTNTAVPGASRTIEISMTDNTYDPPQIHVTKGETVTLRFRNNGTVRHEAILGDDAAQMRHHDEMTASTGKMEHGGGHAGTPAESTTDTIAVEPASSGDITRTFTESGSILIGCHEPGHWEAGMKSLVIIS